MQQRRQRGQQKAGKRTQIRHKHQNAGNHADGKTRIQPHKHQTEAVNQAHNQHHHQLAAQKFAQHFIHIARNALISAHITARHHRADAVRPTLPVEQKVIEQKRQQKQIGHAQHHRADLLHQRGHDSLQSIAHRAGVRLQPRHNRRRVEREMAAQQHIDPRQHFVLHKIHNLRQPRHHIVKLIHQHRHNHQSERQNQHQRENHHQHRRQSALHAFIAQLFHQRVQNIGQHRRHDKRRENIAQGIKEPHHHRQHRHAGHPRPDAARFLLIHCFIPVCKRCKHTSLAAALHLPLRPSETLQTAYPISAAKARAAK